MLIEFRNVKQEARGRRRWFEDTGLELIVWQNADDGIDGFQICYDGAQGERALTWRLAHGFSHARVDSGDDTPLKNQTPLLLPEGAVPWDRIVEAFKARSETLEPELRALILRRLSERS
jgi:hypothetical protein